MGKAIYQLSDADILAKLRELTEELSRRTQQATGCLDSGQLIRGNEMAKRALTIAVAGHHSILFVGPHGCGKTMLRRLAADLGHTASFEALPCQCGNVNNPKLPCECTTKQVASYRRKAWPVADMTVEVPALPTREILAERTPDTSREQIVDTIARMYTQEFSVNSPLSSDCHNLLKASINELGLSAREVATIREVAVTIARLDGVSEVRASHICEAINYRMLRIA